MAKKIATMKSLKIGKYILIEDKPCKVTGLTHSKPGKHGGAKVRVDATGIFDGQKKSIIGPVSQNIEVPIIDKQTAQVLTIIGDTVQLMDMVSYETFELDISKEFKNKLSEGVSVLYMDVMGKKKIIQTQ